MKKILLIILCLTIMIPLVTAQEADINKRGYLGISIGAAIPVGEFGSTDIGGEYSGFAKTGLSFQLINFGYRLGKNLGIAGLWSGSAFNMDVDALVNNSGLGAVNVEADPWSFGAFMGGLLISIPSDKFDIDFRGLIGFSYGKTPEMTISGYDIEGNYAFVKQTSGTSNSFAYDLGVGIRYNVSRLICINLLLDYMGSKPKFSTDLFSANGYYGKSEFDQPMNHITITGGIGFRLK